MIFGTSVLCAATMTTATNGFRRTGIWVTDPNVFTDANLLPAVTTDIQLENEDQPNSEATEPTAKRMETPQSA